jgi:hypothetical protein
VAEEWRGKRKIRMKIRKRIRIRSRSKIRRFVGSFLCAALSVVLVVGCGDGKSSVNGTVTMDGQPVASGAITFIKTEGEMAREGAIIQDGSFRANVPPGTYKLELQGQKVVGKRKQKGFDGKDEEVELTEELFPERYNTKSELREVIRPGQGTLKLDLKSGK